ncbi:hypothetical protein X975_04647, partial [Stegodyphus mimosarum]
MLISFSFVSDEIAYLELKSVLGRQSINFAFGIRKAIYKYAVIHL